MSDEANNGKDAAEEWVMPAPIFRSSEGYTPKTASLDPQEDVPTEPGLGGEDTDDEIVVSPSEEVKGGETPAQSVHASTKIRIRHHKKKGGCAKVFGVIAGTIALSIFAIIAAVVYFLVFYKSADTSF